jgi:O-antigen biosynthesis protein WbqP
VWYRGFKRVADILLALALLPFAVPIVLVAAALIRADSRGSPLFVQQRVGQGERRFTLLKLRTMRAGAPQAGTHLVSASETTTLGRWLRRTKIDELPQVLCVLAGTMSFVGPRPCLPVQTELIEARKRRNVYAVLPGITGPAQVAGIDMSDPERLAEVDGAYVATRGLLVDLRCLIATAIGGGRGDFVQPVADER